MRIAWLSIAVLAVGCGESKPAPLPPAAFSTVTGAPKMAAPLPAQTLTAASEVQRFGVSSQGTLVVSLADATYEYTGGALVERTLYADTGEPTSLGAVSSIGPRAQAGAWLAAANGLYELDGFFLTRSPLAVGKVRAAVEQPTGPMAGLWLATDQGLVLRTAAATTRYTVDGSGDATQVVLEPQGTAAFAVVGGALYRLSLSGSDLAAEKVPLEVGAIRGLAASPDNLYAATPVGLLRWSPTLDPKWAVLTLADGDANLPLDAVAADPVDGRVWALAGSLVVQIDGWNSTGYAQGAGHALTVDQLGDVWLADGASLTRLQSATSSSVTFSTDLSPWLSAHCLVCHADFSDVAVFAPKAEQALYRVRTGDMPRCGGGVPCPADQHLTADQYSVLEQWIRGGKQP